MVDPGIDPLIPFGSELVAYVDELLRGDADTARTTIEANLGDEGLVCVAGVVGTFQMMNRVADATGMPVGKGTRRDNEALISELGLDRFDHLD